MSTDEFAGREHRVRRPFAERAGRAAAGTRRAQGDRRPRAAAVAPEGLQQNPLSHTLNASGITYQHLRAAGNPHRHLKANTAKCLALYTQHLVDHPNIVALIAAELHGKRPVALLCFERQHNACHRSRLIEAVDRASAAPLHVVRIE